MGCAAEVLIVADEMRSWMRSETVEAHARRKDATEGNSECAKPQKLRDYLASTPAAAKPSPRTMEDVEKELAQQQAPAPSPAANAAPAPAPKRAWGGQRPTAAAAPPPAAPPSRPAAAPAPARAPAPAAARASTPVSAPAPAARQPEAGGDEADDGWQEQRSGRKKKTSAKGQLKKSRARGAMLWFDPGKGYGFIKPVSRHRHDSQRHWQLSSVVGFCRTRRLGLRERPHTRETFLFTRTLSQHQVSAAVSFPGLGVSHVELLRLRTARRAAASRHFWTPCFKKRDNVRPRRCFQE